MRRELESKCGMLFGYDARRTAAERMIAQLASLGVAFSNVYWLGYGGPKSNQLLVLKSKSHTPDHTKIRTVRIDTDFSVVSDITEEKQNELGFRQRLTSSR